MTFDELETRLRAHKGVVIGVGIDEQGLVAAEQAVQLRFPEELQEYLRRLGHLEIGHLELYGLGRDVPSHLHLLRIIQSERNEAGCPLREDLVPLLNDGSGNLYCMGSTGEESGSIYFWDHELGAQQSLEKRASSLVSWILGLLADLEGGPQPGKMIQASQVRQ